MPVLNTNAIDAVKLGSTNIDCIYKAGTRIWPDVPPPPVSLVKAWWKNCPAFEIDKTAVPSEATGIEFEQRRQGNQTFGSWVEVQYIHYSTLGSTYYTFQQAMQQSSKIHAELSYNSPQPAGQVWEYRIRYMVAGAPTAWIPFTW